MGAGRRAALGVAVSALVAAAACSSSSSVVTHQSTTAVAPSTSSAPTSAPPSTAPPAGGPSTTAQQGQQTLTITPSSGLAASQSVRLAASGFSPNEPLVVTQCADKGNSTGPGDCNLAGMLMVTSDAGGHVSSDFHVVKGPFGGNNIVCGAQQRCLVSVSQAAASPTEEADAPVTFS
jgi:hypothetical protein